MNTRGRIRTWITERSSNYRSRDERLIALLKHHIYGDELVTFPGGADEQGLRFVHVAPSGCEIDKLGSKIPRSR